MKSLNSFSIFRSSRPNLPSSYISLDCRLTVGSPSGMTAKLQVNSFMRFAVFLTLIFTLGVGNVWGDPTKCTSTSDLTAGDVYYISSASSYSSDAVVMAKSTGGNNYPQSTFSSSPVELTLGGNSTDGWTFSYQDGGTTYYVNATDNTSKNYLQRVESNDKYGQFTISFSDGAAVITCKGKSSRNIVRYNSNSSCFSCYSSGQAAVYLYKKATSCSNKVIISKGSESHGTFTLDKTGEQNACDALSVTVTPEPDEHYHVASVSATNPATTGTAGDAVDNGDGTWTITYSANSKGASTVNVTFAEDTKHTLTFYNNGAQVEQIQVYDGEKIGASLPSLTSSEACHTTSRTFAGWTTENIGSTPVHTVDVDKIVDYWTKPTGDMTIYAIWATIPASATTTFAAADYDAETAPITKIKDNITLYFDAGSIYKSNTPYTFTITSGDHYFSITASNKVLAKLETTCNNGTYCLYSVSDGTLSPNSSTASQTVTGINTYNVECYPKTNNQIRMQTCAVYCYDNYITACAACTADPTVGTAQLNGSISLSSVGVTVTGSDAGTNCSWEDYGFVWGTSNSSGRPNLTSDSGNKEQVGTSGSTTTWDGALTGTFSTGTTYYYRAYGKNAKDGAAFVYGDVASFKLQKVVFNANGGTGTMSDQVVLYNTTTALTSNSFTRDGFGFEGWATSSSGDVVYADGANITLTADQTLYAKWGAVHYTITYDKGANGTGSISAGNKTHGVDFTLSSETFTREGYTQDGWSTSDGGDKVYDLGGSYSDNAAITLYPHWTIKNYTVSWSVNGSTWTGAEHGTPSTSVTYNTKPSTIPTAPDGDEVCGGKVFRGWTSDPDYSGSGEGLFDTQAGAPEITENTTFYAVFATASGGGEVLNEEFDNNSTNDSSTPITSSTFSNFSGSTSSAYKSQYGGIKLGTKDNTGHITSKALDLSSAFTVSLDARYFSSGSDNADINIIVDWGETNEVTRTISHNELTSSFTNFSFDFAAATSSSTIRIETFTKRAYIDNVIVTTGSLSDYATTCCQQPATQLSMTADKTELVGTGLIELSLAGGNGEDITWSCRDESDVNCDALLTSTSNSGATFKVSSPSATTKTYIVQALQPEKDLDGEGIVCGKTLKMEITVKTQWTITFKTTDKSVLTTYSTTTVTDGDTYTFPDLSDDYICAENFSFAGWKAVNSDGAPEYAAGSSAKASADKTWYAVWMYSKGTTTITRDKYVRMTSGQSIAANDVVVVAYVDGEVALKQMTEDDEAGAPIAVDFSADKSYLTFAPGTAVMQLKALWHDDADNDLDGWLLQDNSADFRLTYSGEKGGTLYYTNKSGWFWDITITAQNNAIIEDTETGYDYSLKYNTSRNVFAFYSSGQKIVQLYRKNGTISIDVPSTPTYSVDNEHCTNGATIRATDGQWVTSAKNQKVRITVPVTAKNFETSGKQLTASSDNSHFSVSFPSHTIPSNKSEVVVNMVVEYTPIEANTIEEANITITTGTGDGNATKVVSVNGRSLPDEFVIVTQKEGKWQALPANMESGATTYSGVEVTPNGGITAIPAAPFNVIYSAREVASSRYEAAGNCVRLVGNNNKCLWGNNSNNTTSIQNWSTLSNTNGAQYEWLLSTADGETYTIANPNHPDYATGRQLAIYALKYGLYKTDATFYLLPVGCSSQPGNLQIVPRRTDATFSWISNASSVTIDLWTNEEMNEGHLSATATSVPYLFTGLAESTQYWYKITPGSDDDCAVTGTFSTTGPTIDVVEWGENSATIFVDIDPETANDPDVSPQIIIAGEVEHGQGSGAAATDIFFSKYFEAEGTAKMLAIYNGTGNAMSLADITILHRSTTKYTPLSLASYGKTAGWIQPGEEIILFNRDNRAAVMSCAENDPTYPSWNNVENDNLKFSGKGTIRLFRGNECIDIIGAMAAGNDINDKAVNPIEGSGRPSFGDANGFVSTSGDDYATKGTVENNYELSTNRCLLIRQNWVTSGDSAVLNNYDDFKTLGTYTGVDSKTHKGEWAGLQVPTAVAPEADYIHTCEGFQEVGKFDYNKYYREYTQISADKYLKDFTRAEDGTYTLPIKYMRQYACLNLKFQLTDHNNKKTILTEKVAQVPIVVKDARNSNDTLFNHIIKSDEAHHNPMVPQSIERCKTCNVVVLSTGTLTKVEDGTTDDVAELGDVKVYPGGKLIVPSGRHYVFNSLAMRRQEDKVAFADIQGGLAENATDASDKGLHIRRPNGVYLDVRINPDNWHFIALPYDCRVGDIMLSDGTPAVVNTDYLLGWYDGAKRAANKSGGWTYITDKDYVLKKGLGYILALPGTDKVKKELRFPMANRVIDEELSDKSIGGLYAYGGDKSDEELRPNHKGWNMIGNPYMITYKTDIVKEPLAMGSLEHELVNGVWYGQWKRTGDARYIVKPVDNGWSNYVQTTITDLEPFTSYFIQIGNKTDGSDNPETENKITFTASQAERASIIRHAPAETDEPMYPVWYGVDIIAPNAERDNTTLLISDEFTDGYDMMDDLVKMRGDYYTYYNKPVLASRNNEGEMAFNALPDTSAATVGVPLNYYAAQAGTYTIATDSRFDLEEVKSAMLYDATNNTYTDLLTQNYEFTASKGNNTDRFTLYVRVERKKAPNSATDIDNLLADGELSLISMGKTLVLSGLTNDADVYVYDMSGKLMNSDHTSGSGGIWRTTVPATGVYFVRVNGINGQQTLRAIVK